MDRYVIISFLLIFAKQSVTIMNRDSLMSIDLNDILNEKLMPMSVLYIKGNSDNLSIQKNGEKQFIQPISHADFDSAFHLMQFHRKMIQNYKCNNYIAKQILADIAPRNVQNRLGIAENVSGKKKNY